MNAGARNRLIKVLGALTIAGAAAAWWAGRAGDEQAAQRDRQEISRITGKMSPLCIGRFVIDMPEEAKIELISRRIHGLNVVTYSESVEEFLPRLERSETQNKAKPDRFGGNRNLEMVRKVETDSGVVGKIFVHSRTVTEGTRTNGLELERYRSEGVTVEALLHGNGVSVDLGAYDYDTVHVDKIFKLAAQFVPNPDNKLPTEPGFCVDRAYFRDPPTKDLHDEITVFAQLPSRPAVEIRLTLMTGTTSGDGGLLKRIAGSNIPRSEAERAGVFRFRAAPRTIGTLAGDEVATRFEENNDATVLRYRWEVNGTLDDVLIPHLTIEMNTGRGSNGPVPSSLSQGAATALWDKITSSIRLHPAQQQRIAQVQAPRNPTLSNARPQ